MLLLLGRNELVGLQSGNDVSKIIAPQLGNLRFLHLSASYQRKGVRRDHADAE